MTNAEAIEFLELIRTDGGTINEALGKGIEALRKYLDPVDLMCNKQKADDPFLKSDPDSVSEGNAVYRQLATILCSRIAQTEPKTSDFGSIDSEKPEIKTDRTTDDTISRAAAIDAAIEAADDWDGGYSKERERFIRDALEELPSAQLDMSGYSDKLWKAAYERGKRDAQTERKTGKWIRNDNCTYSCSLCQAWIPEEQHYYARFCLRCGADMRGEQDEDR